MALHYVGTGRDQLFLLPVSMRDWLDEGHLAWFVLDVVAKIDTSGFHARHRNDGVGRPAYDPDMMLALLFYAYGMGIRSSRRIEALCGTDAAFGVISAGSSPDHGTIARFVVDHERAIEDAFVAVLRLCAAAGLVSVGVIAVDGTKIGSDAALGANRGREAIVAELERLRAEVEAMVAEARATDAAEDAAAVLFGGDALPVGLATRSGRLARLEAAFAAIAADDAAAAAGGTERAAKAATAAASGRRLRGRKPKDPYQALAQAEAEVELLDAKMEANVAHRRADRAETQARAEEGGRRVPGPAVRRPRARELQELEQAKQRVIKARCGVAAAAAAQRQVNLTDPESRIMKTQRGWIQGYNAQAAVNANQIVIHTAVTQDTNDVNQYLPMVAATQAALAAAGIGDPIGVVLADAGYWSLENATATGPERLIATNKDYKQRQAARQMGTTTGPPPPGASPLQAMEHRLRTPAGADTYAQRSHTVEPVFGNTKENRGWRRFRRRGLNAARSEWALMNLSHNLAKLFHHYQTHPTHTLA
jgi:transposase